jgi:hypothetical protein
MIITDNRRVDMRSIDFEKNISSFKADVFEIISRFENQLETSLSRATERLDGRIRSIEQEIARVGEHTKSRKNIE